MFVMNSSSREREPRNAVAMRLLTLKVKFNFQGEGQFSRKVKESPRLCPDLSMDFVRLIFFEVFGMLINAQKKF